MKVRSVTYFLNSGWPLDEDALNRAGDLLAAARSDLENAGYEVETGRLATVPFPEILPSSDSAAVVHLAQTLESAAASRGYDYVSIGSALPAAPESYGVIPDVLAATENVFASGVIGSQEEGISLPAVRACAQVIRRAATIDANGFGNLYFTALANVAPGGPFFPSAYHKGGPPSFALATEAADLAVDAFAGAGSLQAACQNLVLSIESVAQTLARVAENLASRSGVSFGGIDFTLAPFPAEGQSIGTALEELGVPAFGLRGSLAAAAILADTLDRAQFPRAGFNGLMLPVLEDATLAARAAQGTLTVGELLMYSAVCGTGLDTVPLPGDTSVEELGAILLDVAALAQRLGKPLTARLMPIPGKGAGELTDFDFPYFANSRVMSTQARAIEGPLAGGETFRLRPRGRADVA